MMKAYMNGKIYTVNENRDWAEAVVIDGSKIAYVAILFTILPASRAALKITASRITHNIRIFNPVWKISL